MSSREMISARQRDNSYRPDYAVAPHVLSETQYIDSNEQVLSLESGYWVKSAKFAFRYYRVTVDGQGQWATSSYSDERVARMLVARVKAYMQQEVA